MTSLGLKRQIAKAKDDAEKMQICLEAVKNSPTPHSVLDSSPLEYVPEKFKTAELCLEAVKKNGRALEYVPENLKTAELCNAAFEQNFWSLEYMPEKFKTEEMCFEAVKQVSMALEYVPEKFKTAEMCNIAVKDYGWSLQFVPENLKTAEMCLEAVKGDGYALIYVPEEFKTLDMCIEIVKQETWAFMVVPENLKEQVTTATGVQQGGTAMLHNEYESALEKGIKEIFEKEVERICFRLITFVEIARREGILALEDKLDKEKVAKRDLFETGIQMAVDGTERAVIENYLDSWIEANCNNSVAYYEKILASIIKTGVLCIQEGYNPRIAEYKITVLIPRELTPDSLMPSSEKYFRKIKQEVGK